MRTFASIILVCMLALVRCNIYGSKEWIPQTRGQVWPKVHTQNQTEKFFIVWSFWLGFSVKTENDHESPCQILEEAFWRYRTIIDDSSKINTEGRKLRVNPDTVLQPWMRDPNFIGELKNVKVIINGKCENSEYPSLDMDEEYSLEISNNQQAVVINANSIWGALRAFETFSQLVYITSDAGVLFINETYIHDFPRFRHRGLLLDTSRHFIPKSNILRVLDAMSYNKLNVFHWHLTDLQSFPYKSTTFPELSEKGAWNPIYAIYDQKDVKEIIEYARKRGIRVLPEFDTPGHTASWGDSHKELLTACYDGGEPTGIYGPLDVSKNFTYSFVEALLKEVTQVFPEDYIHIGGDEVDFDCWQSNPDINEFMDRMNMSGDYAALEAYYVQKVIDIVSKFKAKPIVWEEVFTTGVDLPESTVVQVWKSDGHPKEVLKSATSSGKQVILSACYYLDVSWNPLDWTTFYKCSPTDFDGTEEQKKLVLGGEIALWAEYVNENNIDTKLWPRGAAGAESLWANVVPSGLSDYIEPATRLEEHICRMIKRGIPTEPASGPNYCL